jgi:hypothetical protein
MPTKPTSPKFQDVHIQGSLETYTFTTGSYLSEQGKLEQKTAHVYVNDGHARSDDLADEELESAIRSIDAFRQQLPQFLKESAELLREKGEYRSYDNSFFFKDGLYSLEASDRNADGTADMVQLQRSKGFTKVSLMKIEAVNIPFCGSRTPTKPGKCGEEERSVFEGHVLSSASSNTVSSWFCVEKELRPAEEGCNENETKVYEFDSTRQGVIQYLRLFDGLFDKK